MVIVVITTLYNIYREYVCIYLPVYMNRYKGTALLFRSRISLNLYFVTYDYVPYQLFKRIVINNFNSMCETIQ